MRGAGGRVGRGAGAGILVALAVLSGCGGDDAPEAAPTSTGAPTTTTSAPGTTTTAPATTSTVVGCDRIVEVVDGDQQVDAVADLDGDGRDDRVHSYRSEDGGRVWWTLQAVLSTGGGATQDVPDDGVAGVAVLGGHDVDGDGDDELWVRVGAGASATIVGLFRLDGCDLERVTLDGEPVELPVGGSVGSASGVACDGTTDPAAHLVVASATNVGDTVYDVTLTEYALGPDGLRALGTTTTSSSIDDPAFGRYTGFTCGAVDLVP